MALSDIFGGGESRAQKKLMHSLTSGYGKAQGYLEPYRAAGNEGLANYQGAANQMQDPAQFYEKMLSGYQQSPAAQMRLQQVLDQLTNRAAATGMSKSGPLSQGILDYSNQIIGADQDQYLQNLLSIFGNYMGAEGNMANMGYGTAGALSNLSTNYSQQYGQAKADRERAIGNANIQGIGTLLNGMGNFYKGGSSQGKPFDFGKGFDAAINPYTSTGQAELSWMKNHGSSASASNSPQISMEDLMNYLSMKRGA